MTENQMKITFGKNFRMLLEQNRAEHPKEWTYQKLEQRLNVTTRAIQKWEKGKSFPTVYKLAMVADLFGVSIDALLSRKRFRISEIEEDNHSVFRRPER